MSATTVKLEGPLLDEIGRIKPSRLTLTAYVREALERDIRQRKLHDAALRYRALLETDETARLEAGEWENTPLERPVKKGRRK